MTQSGQNDSDDLWGITWAAPDINNALFGRSCGATEASCECCLAATHAGSHVCRCGGSWFYDLDGVFHVVSYPAHLGSRR